MLTDRGYAEAEIADAGVAFRRRGMLPLGQMLDELWAMPRELADDNISDADWARFRDDVETANGGSGMAGSTGTRSAPRVDEGPFGLVVREIFFEPDSTGSHDYLGCPEIVQDISRCCASEYNVNIEQRFCDASKPCIVKFRSTQLWHRLSETGWLEPVRVLAPRRKTTRQALPDTATDSSRARVPRLAVSARSRSFSDAAMTLPAHIPQKVAGSSRLRALLPARRALAPMR